MSIVSPHRPTSSEIVKVMLQHRLKSLFAAAVMACAVLTVQAPALANGLGDTSTSAELSKQVKELEKLPAQSLEAKATKGDALAGLAMAQQFAKEAQALAIVPALANSAAEDAARWYSLAAQMGALQSRPLNGISLRPLRATRSRHR